MRRSTLVLALLLSLGSAEAREKPSLLAQAWPVDAQSVVEVGRGVGIVFSPDLSVPGNCRFFEALGFACFESADWLRTLADIHAWNIEHDDSPITTLVLETHGTNGHGLRVQSGKKPSDDRSYIAVAALQEILESIGIRHIILSACNSGRLLRPEIYRVLNRDPGDPLFLPATRGIIDATESFDPKRSKVTVMTSANSRIETTVVGSLRELSPAAREVLKAAAAARHIELPKTFAISEMMIQMLTRSPQLELRTGAYVEELSNEQTPADGSERLFRAFMAYLDSLAAAKTTAATVAAGSSR